MTYRKALDKMDRILEQNLLYDFYGELLTEHQQRVYEDAVYNDMSLSEIAGEQGISRQGVHDLIKRCDRILQDYESKLHLVERFMAAKEKIGEIEQLTAENDTDPGERMERIRELSRSLLKELYEAASIDGAGRWKCTLHITIPEISVTIGIMFIMAVGGMLNAGYDQILLLQQPANNQISQVLDTYIIQTGIRYGKFEYATAIGLFKSVFSLIMVAGTNYLTQKYAEVGLW